MKGVDSVRLIATINLFMLQFNEESTTIVARWVAVVVHGDLLVLRGGGTSRCFLLLRQPRSSPSTTAARPHWRPRWICGTVHAAFVRRADTAKWSAPCHRHGTHSCWDRIPRPVVCTLSYTIYWLIHRLLV